MGLVEEPSYYSQFKLSFCRTDPASKSLGLWQGLKMSVQRDSCRNFWYSYEGTRLQKSGVLLCSCSWWAVSGQGREAPKAPNFSSGSRKAIGRHESNQMIFFFKCTVQIRLCVLICDKRNSQAVWLYGYFSTAQSRTMTSQTRNQWNLGFWDILCQFHRHNIKTTVLSLWSNTLSIKLRVFLFCF